MFKLDRLSHTLGIFNRFELHCHKCRNKRFWVGMTCDHSFEMNKHIRIIGIDFYHHVAWLGFISKKCYENV